MKIDDVFKYHCRRGAGDDRLLLHFIRGAYYTLRPFAFRAARARRWTFIYFLADAKNFLRKLELPLARADTASRH